MNGDRFFRATTLALGILLAAPVAHAVTDGDYGKVLVSWKDPAGEKHFLTLRLRYSLYGWSTEVNYLYWLANTSHGSQSRTVVGKNNWHVTCGLGAYGAVIDVFPPVNNQPAYITLQLTDLSSSTKTLRVVPGPDDIFWVDWASLP